MQAAGLGSRPYQLLTLTLVEIQNFCSGQLGLALGSDLYKVPRWAVKDAHFAPRSDRPRSWRARADVAQLGLPADSTPVCARPAVRKCMRLAINTKTRRWRLMRTNSSRSRSIPYLSPSVSAPHEIFGSLLSFHTIHASRRRLLLTLVWRRGWRATACVAHQNPRLNTKNHRQLGNSEVTPAVWRRKQERWRLRSN